MLLGFTLECPSLLTQADLELGKPGSSCRSPGSLPHGLQAPCWRRRAMSVLQLPTSWSPEAGPHPVLILHVPSLQATLLPLQPLPAAWGGASAWFCCPGWLAFCPYPEFLLGQQAWGLQVPWCWSAPQMSCCWADVLFSHSRRSRLLSWDHHSLWGPDAGPLPMIPSRGLLGPPCL